MAEDLNFEDLGSKTEAGFVALEAAAQDLKRSFDEVGRAFLTLGAVIGKAFGPILGRSLDWPHGSDEWVEVAWLIFRRGHPVLALYALRHSFRAHCEEINL